MILSQGEEKGAYATIVTAGCGGYCWRVLLRQHRGCGILLECEDKGAYANIVTVGCG